MGSSLKSLGMDRGEPRRPTEAITTIVAAMLADCAHRRFGSDCRQAAVSGWVSRREPAFGTGLAGHLAAVFATRLRRMGHDALCISATGAALADSLLTMRTRDALLALVNEQAPTESKLVLEEARRRGLPVVLVTD